MQYFWLWIIVLIGSLFLEIITLSSLVSIWFTIGAIGALVANQLHVSFLIQVVVFFVLSILSLLFIRPIAQDYLRGNVVHTNADRVIGAITTVIKQTTFQELGEVKINGVIWNIKSVDNTTIEEGNLVEVLAIDGVKLIVRKIEK